eukprot:scaffold1202_cov384-Prasinococcus_capsulatus_cf.AAC.11
MTPEVGRASPTARPSLSTNWSPSHIGPGLLRPPSAPCLKGARPSTVSRGGWAIVPVSLDLPL